MNKFETHLKNTVHLKLLLWYIKIKMRYKTNLRISSDCHYQCECVKLNVRPKIIVRQ